MWFERKTTDVSPWFSGILMAWGEERGWLHVMCGLFPWPSMHLPDAVCHARRFWHRSLYPEIWDTHWMAPWGSQTVTCNGKVGGVGGVERPRHCHWNSKAEHAVTALGEHEGGSGSRLWGGREGPMKALCLVGVNIWAKMGKSISQDRETWKGHPKRGNHLTKAQSCEGTLVVAVNCVPPRPTHARKK